MEKGLAVLAAEDRVRRAGRADNDVGLAGRLIKLVEWDYLARKALCHPPRALQGPVGHQNRACPLLDQMPRRQFAHLARAHQKNRAPFQRSKDFAGQLHGDRGDGDRIRADFGLGTDFFGGGKGALQQVFELASHGARSVGHGEGLLDLAKNLRFAHHH